MPIAIRPAAESDLPALAALESACFAHPWSEKSLAETLGNGRSLFLLAEREGEALGYLGMEYVLDEGGITNVAVFPVHRRQGIADALLNELLRRPKALALPPLRWRCGKPMPLPLLFTKNMILYRWAAAKTTIPRPQKMLY